MSTFGCGDRACYDYYNMLPNINSKLIARLISHKYFPLAVLLLANLLAGLLTVKDYGASWDDPKRYAYATNSLKAYLGKAGDLVDDKGPFYVMVARVGTEILVRLNKNWQTMDAWHWMHFLTFQMSLAAIYSICLRLMNPLAAWAATLLFSTQPLLWGHAFINSKDIPFMAFFLGSVAIGLGMADNMQNDVFYTNDQDSRNPLFYPTQKSRRLSAFNLFLRRLKGLFTAKWVWYAGVMWGLTSSIRVLGPAAGLLVGIYFILKSGRKAIPPLLASFAIAAVVAYLSWPGLWGSPIAKFSQSLTESTDFPWQGKVLFNGVGYRPNELPPSYLPYLMGIQFSETFLVSLAFGLAVLVIKSIRKQLDGVLSLMLLAWLLLPIVGVIFFKPRLYDNFRHFFFIIPPLFILSGLGIHAIFKWLRKPFLCTAMIIALVSPNIFWMIQLHPYEYTYYNSLVGGVGGAFRRFETDYWTTSYRQAVEYLNQAAPPNGKVIVWGPSNLAAYYARQDLKIVTYSKKLTFDEFSAVYAILSTRQDKDLKLYRHAPIIWQVGKDEAIFTVVKQLAP